MYQGIILSDSSVVEDLKTAHLKTLSAPLDAYWEEALIGFADHYEVKIDDAKAGFYCLNSDNQLVAFHLVQQYANHGENVLSYIINEHTVSAALVGTNDPYFLSLCLDIATRSEVHTMLFQDNQKIPDERDESDRFSFDLATTRDDVRMRESRGNASLPLQLPATVLGHDRGQRDLERDIALLDGVPSLPDLRKRTAPDAPLQAVLAQA